MTDTITQINNRLDELEKRLNTDADALALQMEAAGDGIKDRLSKVESRTAGHAAWLSVLTKEIDDTRAKPRLAALEVFQEKTHSQTRIRGTEAIETILRLADSMPGTRIDHKAPEKLMAEYNELLKALEEKDQIGAWTEVADIVYYASKAIALAAHLVDVDILTAFAFAEAKYTLRAELGNKKDDKAERAACLRAMLRSTK